MPKPSWPGRSTNSRMLCGSRRCALSSCQNRKTSPESEVDGMPLEWNESGMMSWKAMMPPGRTSGAYISKSRFTPSKVWSASMKRKSTGLVSSARSTPFLVASSCEFPRTSRTACPRETKPRSYIAARPRESPPPSCSGRSTPTRTASQAATRAKRNRVPPPALPTSRTRRGRSDETSSSSRVTSLGIWLDRQEKSTRNGPHPAVTRSRVAKFTHSSTVLWV